MGRLRGLAQRILHRAQSLAMNSWKHYVARRAGTRALLYRMLANKQQRCFDDWWLVTSRATTTRQAQVVLAAAMERRHSLSSKLVMALQSYTGHYVLARSLEVRIFRHSNVGANVLCTLLAALSSDFTVCCTAVGHRHAHVSEQASAAIAGL